MVAVFPAGYWQNILIIAFELSSESESFKAKTSMKGLNELILLGKQLFLSLGEFVVCLDASRGFGIDLAEGEVQSYLW